MSSEILFIHVRELGGLECVCKAMWLEDCNYLCFVAEISSLVYNFGDNYILMADYLLIILFSISTI